MRVAINDLNFWVAHVCPRMVIEKRPSGNGRKTSCFNSSGRVFIIPIFHVRVKLNNVNYDYDKLRCYGT